MNDLDTLLKLYEPALLKECWKYRHQQSDVWDLFQDAAVKMTAGFSKFDHDKPFLPWARKIIFRAFLDEKRARNAEFKGIDVVNRANLEHYALLEPSVEENLTDLLQYLPAFESKLLTAIFVDGVPQQFIADYFGISQQAVSKRVQKACFSLREAYGKYFMDQKPKEV